MNIIKNKLFIEITHENLKIKKESKDKNLNTTNTRN